MTISQILEKMIVFSKGNIHDIDHLIRVWAYAKTIGELEELDADTQFILEVAALAFSPYFFTLSSLCVCLSPIFPLL